MEYELMQWEDDGGSTYSALDEPQPEATEEEQEEEVYV